MARGTDAHTEPTETTTQLISRLHSTLADRVELHIAPNPAIEPIYIQRVFLCATSPWFQRALDRAITNGHEDVLRFGDTSSLTIQVFIYWLFHKRMPEQADVEGIVTTFDYQSLLCKAWIFAEDREVPAMQDEAIKALVENLKEEPLTVKLLQDVLKKTKMGSQLRLMLLEETIFLEHDSGKGMLGKVEKQYLFGYLHDLSSAEQAFEARRRRRGKAEDYFVKTGQA